MSQTFERNPLPGFKLRVTDTTPRHVRVTVFDPLGANVGTLTVLHEHLGILLEEAWNHQVECPNRMSIKQPEES